MTQGFDELESMEQKDFESFMMRYKPEFRDFEKVGEFTYSNTLTSIAYDSYLAGAASRQAEIDELQKKYDAMYNAFVVADDCRKEWHRCYVGIHQSEDGLQKRVKELELINFDSELHFDAAKEHIDNLQKRIDVALDHAINHGGYDDLTHIISILKGVVE